VISYVLGLIPDNALVLRAGLRQMIGTSRDPDDAERDAGVLPITCSLGPPGAGTSTLAQRLITILPATTLA
jgi:hypothetical protein